jgi:hypothetical protein
METQELKTRKRNEQKGKCAISGQKLKKETSLFDIKRIIPKAKGGLYNDANIVVVDPIAHAKSLDILRIRTPEIAALKVLIDGREQIRKFHNSLKNRLTAAEKKIDFMDRETEIWIKEKIKESTSQLTKIDQRITKYLKRLKNPIVKTALAVKGIGPVTVSYMLVYVDIEKARYASSLWSYVGLDKPSYDRYKKGETGGGNKTLRTVLYTTACSMIKTRAPYREVYDNEKQKLSASLLITKTWIAKDKLVSRAWKDVSPGHRHGAAIRKTIKHFLADFWFVWRTLEGLDTPCLYVEAKLGHTGIVKPQERGWKF